MKQKSKKIILLFIISLVMILGFATMVNAADDEFKINETKADVVLNRTKLFYCENTPTGETVTWSSSNSNIVSVEPDGTNSAKATAKAIGTATITATAGSKTATCTINVVYNSFIETSDISVSLVIGEYESKTVKITTSDYDNNKITNPDVQWKSNDESIAKVDSNGKITAVKAGTTKVIATVAGGSREIDVTVTNLPTFTDFSKAEYEYSKPALGSLDLKIKNLDLKNERVSRYYYITSENKKPNIELTDDGEVSSKSTIGSYPIWNILSLNDDGSLSGFGIENYMQFNQDLYIWIVETRNLENPYYDDNDNAVVYKTEFVVSGKKLERIKYPTYAELFINTMVNSKNTQIVFTIPNGDTTKRKFHLKIGEISDKSILNGLKNNNGESWNSLFEYAKKSNAVFDKNLTTSNKNGILRYDTDDGAEKLDFKVNDGSYYYMYVVFDDENGKYYPASGVTIAKASVATSGSTKGDWYLFFLGSEDFNWDDFGTIQTGTAIVDGNTTGTTKPKSLPKTGSVAIGLVIVAMVGTAVFFKVKNNEYKGI